MRFHPSAAEGASREVVSRWSAYWMAVAFIVSAPVACTASPSPSGPNEVDASCPLGCGPGVTPEELDASLGRRVQLRLSTCLGQEGCHASSVEGLTFPAGNELVDLINVPSTERPDLLRVRPGDPSASYLYLKVLGDGGIEGGRMPPGEGLYDPRIASTFFSWMEAGASPP